LVGVITVQVFGSLREADARECYNIIAFNASKGRCENTWLGEEIRIGP
jgi:hypothetical protein